jgi:DMSO reductase anchor subunit
MKLSTRIAHARIKLKHKFLRLRVQKPLYYQTLVAFMLVVGLGGVISAYLLYSSKPKVISSTEQPQLAIKEYSINAKVTSLTADQITVTTTAVQTQNGISTVVDTNKFITTNLSTPVTQTIVNQTQIQTTSALLSDIKVGDLITVYTHTNPNDSDFIPANKIEILK